MDITEAKKSVADYMGRCYQRGLTTITGGNISLRYGDIMLITPSGKAKSSLSADDIAEVRIGNGENLTPHLKLSIESGMHRLVYIKNPGVNAVVHTHPVFCCLFAASDEEINTTLIAESWYLLDKVVKVPYELMGTEELAKENVPLAVGPTLGHASKFELQNKTWETPGILAKAGCHVSIITDAPVIPLHYLPLCAGMAIKAGMDEYDALRAITINPAEHIGIADRVGSLEVGKDADVVILDGSPFTVEGEVRHVFINGREIEL